MHNQELGDYICAESGVDFRPDVADIGSNVGAGMNCRRRRRRTEAVEKKYPPSIPLLSNTAWVMKKYSTSEGRLVIREEKVRRHECFQAHRSNGRLRLNLVPLDEAEESCKEQGAGGGGEEGENVFSGEEINSGDERMISDPTRRKKCISE